MEHCDPELTMHELLATVHDPGAFADLLRALVQCPACAAMVVGQCVYQLAGALLDSDVDMQDLTQPPCGCAHPLPGEANAMRLALCAAAGDDEAVGYTLAEIMQCPACSMSALMAQTEAAVGLMTRQVPAWRSVVELSLLRLLDEAAR